MRKRRERHEYDIEVGGHSYRVAHERSSYNNWEWRWIVEGGGGLRRHLCEPDGRTHKRVVAAVEKFLIDSTAT